MKTFSVLQVVLYFMLPVMARAQTAPSNLSFFQEKIDETQKLILNLSGINGGAVYAATAKIDSLQKSIEADTTVGNNNKIIFLRGLNDALLEYYNKAKNGTAPIAILPGLVDVFAQCMHNEINNESIAPAVKLSNLDIGQIIAGNFSFSHNAGLQEVLLYFIYLDCLRNPKKILETITKHPDMPGKDTLVALLARLDPETVYTWAAAGNAVSETICSTNDRLVKLICRLAHLNTGRQFFPFLDEMYQGKLAFESIDSALNDGSQYYKLLVQTEMDYAERIRMKDTPVGMESIASRLHIKAMEVYVEAINDLHDAPDEVRFKVIDKLSPEELYYLPIFTEEEIYTSSYVKGVYPRVFRKLNRSDSLLMRLSFDHFKKWVKIAANFATLDDFLKRMDEYNAELLMKAFVNGLDKTNSLEDAVDVANSFGSINDKAVRRLILNQVQYNLQKARAAGSGKGINIYSILNTLFLSMDSANHVDVSKILGIPPVYYMPLEDLKNGTDSVIVEQFFYGDKDGNENYEQFRSDFSNSNWKITENAEWITVTSTHGTKVVIYSNKPLDEKKGLDAAARADMIDYMDSLDLRPTMLIHRGHSYYLDESLEKLQRSDKIILLGSCGGYQSLKKVLNSCPAAHIVASKQTGSKTVNGPLIKEALETLRQGKDLNWITLWETLKKDKVNSELFDDYIPPYKNLGALFLMAYNRMHEAQEQ